jgi:hypothetical protein
LLEESIMQGAGKAPTPIASYAGEAADAATPAAFNSMRLARRTSVIPSAAAYGMVTMSPKGKPVNAKLAKRDSKARLARTLAAFTGRLSC